MANRSMIYTELLSWRIQGIVEHRDAIIAAIQIVSMIAVAGIALIEQMPSVLLSFYVFGLFGIFISRALGKTEQRLFVLVYALNVLFVLALYVVYLHRYGTPYYGGGSDDRMFEETARQFVERFGWFDYARLMRWYKVRSVTAYVYLLSLLQRTSVPFGGFHTLIPRFLNSFLLADLAIMVYRAGKRHFSLTHATAVVAALSLGLAPLAMYVSAHTFRDTLVTLLLFGLVYLWSSLPTYDARTKLVVLVATPLLFLFLWELRQQVAQMLLLLLPAALYFSYAKKNRLIRMGGLLAGILLGVVLIFNLLGWITIIPHFSWEEISIQYRRYVRYRSALGEGGISGRIFTAPLPVSLVLRLAYLMVTPLPVLSPEIERSLLSVGTLVQLVALPFVALGVASAWRRWKVWPYLLSLGILYLSIAFVTFSVRHILMFYPFAVLLVAYGYKQYRKRRVALRWVYLGYYFSAIAAVAVYLNLKA